ncbi:hypothetical protein H0H92_012628 [Tricholoma furcatifolium]|nr:hypothetical protein H0H92_011359 [Tricholoma furcatifolium]KAG6827247.1 hypothetical protein H0H92_012628 [Tricholoma furcatifolium]
MSEVHNLAEFEPVPITPSPSESTLPQHYGEQPQQHTRMLLTDLTVDIPESHRVPKHAPEPSRPRWNTLEFKIYYAVALMVVPLMAWVPISLSLPSHPNYDLYSGVLSRGWIPYRKVDNSDAQYRGFRSNFWILTTLAAVYLFAKAAWIRLGRGTSLPAGDNTHLLKFNLVCSFFILFGLHGTSIFKILVILSANYAIARTCKGHMAGPVLTWVFNGVMLFVNDRYNGYRFGEILSSLEVLDGYQGAYKRWYIVFNITMLRLVSFNLDYYWACNASKSSQEPKHHRTLTHTERMLSHPPHMYSFSNYLAYVLYPPLYLAGPIMTFNDFLWQHRRPTRVTIGDSARYAIRLLASLLTMEFILHFMYVVAIKDRKAWKGATPAEISLIGFWNLIIVWLKLLIPWRFFRLWALLDGIEPPENMVRCMANNYSTSGFWRSWHRSYNLWIIRYIYIPLGGSKRVLLNTLLVFTFVALWHDLTFRLLAWGWLVSLFVVPEVLAAHLLPQSKFNSEPWYRHVCAVGGILNVLMMMGANLVGFVVGTNGVEFFVGQLFGTSKGKKRNAKGSIEGAKRQGRWHLSREQFEMYRDAVMYTIPIQ